jgi:hypothetical protein
MSGRDVGKYSKCGTAGKILSCVINVVLHLFLQCISYI